MNGNESDISPLETFSQRHRRLAEGITQRRPVFPPPPPPPAPPALGADEIRWVNVITDEVPPSDVAKPSPRPSRQDREHAFLGELNAFI